MPSAFKADFAAHVLRAGGVVAYPTEAIWGLGCDPHNPLAVAKLLMLKERSVSKGLILIAASIEQCADYLEGLSRQEYQMLEASWPGHVTWLVPDNGMAPSWVRGDSDKVAIRVSAHPVVVDLCRSFGGPIVSTSANISGQTPIENSWQFRKTFGKKLDFYLGGALGGGCKPSEIRDLETGQVIRQG